MLDLVTGKIEWLRIEPPGEDTIEFRYEDSSGECAYQIKRGISGGGHWTMSALRPVIYDFGEILKDDPGVRCTFCSEHAASELKELSERARSATDLSEFTAEFLRPAWLAKPWRTLSEIWGTDDVTTFQWLRRITATTASEDHLRQDINIVLDLLFTARSEVSSAVLTDLALASVHQRLTSAAILAWLAERGIEVSLPRPMRGFSVSMAPPPATGIRRESELEQIAELIGVGKNTILLGGISGIGKTTVAAQWAAQLRSPVCWIDCGLVSTASEALAVLSEYTEQILGLDTGALAPPAAGSDTASVSRLLGDRLRAAGVTVIWDGVVEDATDGFHDIIDALSTIFTGNAAQLVTAHTYPDRVVGRFGFISIGGLSKDVVRGLLVDAFPAAGVGALERAQDATQGHPYLLQLLVGAAHNVDLETATRRISTGRGFDNFVAGLLELLSDDSRRILNTLAWLDLPFTSGYIDDLGGTSDTVSELATRFAIVRAGGNRYRVHEIMRNLVRRSSPDDLRTKAHGQLALLIQNMDRPSWIEVRAMLHHASEASMDELVRHAGSALLQHASNSPNWSLVHDSAEKLAKTPLSTDQPYPHFMLGKSCRIRGELEQALCHYEAAEKRTKDALMLEQTRYERASVLWDLGRREEAVTLYRQLEDSPNAATAVYVKIPLARDMAENGDVPEAVASLKQALLVAESANLTREVADIHHATGSILADDEQWQEARSELKIAHDTRHTVSGREKWDVYGWFHLFGDILRVELALENKDGARAAAHSLFHFALTSGSLSWEVNAACALCAADPDPTNEEVAAATARLRALASDSSKDPEVRLHALVGVIRCEWSLKRHEQSMVGLFELLALGEEHNLPVPFFAHMPSDGSRTENILAGPGGWVLLTPPDCGPEFLIELANRTLEQRPELAQYAKPIIAVPKEVSPDPEPESGR